LQTRKPKIATTVDVTNNLINTVNSQLDRLNSQLKEVQAINDEQRRKMREMSKEIERLRALVPHEHKLPTTINPDIFK